MRPGSPVKPLHTTPTINGSALGTIAPKLIGFGSGTVWVALATFTKAVQVNNKISTTPISGGPQGIFNRPQVEKVEVNTAEVIAVGTKAEADQAVADHQARNAQLQAEYSVTEHKVGYVKPEPVQQQSTYPCIGGCGRTLSGGVSYCEPCRQKLWASSGWRGED